MTEIIAGIQILFGFIIFPLLIILSVIIIGSALNFIPSYYIAKYVCKITPKIKWFTFIFIFLFCAIIIHLNYRIPGIVSDYINTQNEYIHIIESVESYIGDTVSIDFNHDDIQYKPVYLGSTWLDTGKYCYGLEKTSLETDKFLSGLKTKGLKLGHQANVPIKLIGTIEKTSTHNKVIIQVLKKDKKVAEYRKQFRTAFWGEQSDSKFIQLPLTFLQSTPTRLLFPDIWQVILSKEPAPDLYTVSDFLSEVIKVRPKTETLEPVALEVSSVNLDNREHVVSKEEFQRGNQKESCKYEEARVRVTRRFIEQDNSSKARIPSGYWLRISYPDKEEHLTYIQAPHGEMYQQATFYKLVCEKEYINLLVSFDGVGQTRAEWESSPAVHQGPKVARTNEEKRIMLNEISRVKAFKQDRILNQLISVWILKYSYNGKLLEASTFPLFQDFPEYLDTLTKQGQNKWRLTGFDLEMRNMDGKRKRIAKRNHEIFLESTE